MAPTLLIRISDIQLYYWFHQGHPPANLLTTQGDRFSQAHAWDQPWILPLFQLEVVCKGVPVF